MTTVRQYGGNGGGGYDGAAGGAGAASTLTNAVRGVSLGSTVYLYETARGGLGGASNGATPGLGGGASASLTYNNSAHPMSEGILRPDLIARGGAGGARRRLIQRRGGTPRRQSAATSTGNISVRDLLARLRGAPAGPRAARPGRRRRRELHRLGGGGEHQHELHPPGRDLRHPLPLRRRRQGRADRSGGGQRTRPPAGRPRRPYLRGRRHRLGDRAGAVSWRPGVDQADIRAGPGAWPAAPTPSRSAAPTPTRTSPRSAGPAAREIQRRQWRQWRGFQQLTNAVVGQSNYGLVAPSIRTAYWRRARAVRAPASDAAAGSRGGVENILRPHDQ